MLKQCSTSYVGNKILLTGLYSRAESQDRVLRNCQKGHFAHLFRRARCHSDFPLGPYYLGVVCAKACSKQLHKSIWNQWEIRMTSGSPGSGREVTFLAISQKSVLRFCSRVKSGQDHLISHVSSFAKCLGKFMGESSGHSKFGFWHVFGEILDLSIFSKIAPANDSTR